MQSVFASCPVTIPVVSRCYALAQLAQQVTLADCDAPVSLLLVTCFKHILRLFQRILL
jgi:hypothetical protein